MANQESDESVPSEEIKEPVQGQFTCRICHSQVGYTWHYTHDGVVGPGGSVTGSHYECKNCSVHFADPTKFSETPFTHEPPEFLCWPGEQFE